jgi:hypothetical protein
MLIRSGTSSATDRLPPPLHAVPRTEPIPASFAQQRLWFMAQLRGGSDACHVPLRFSIRGELHTIALTRALDRLVERHEALRTRFKVIDQDVFQVIDSPNTLFTLQYYDLRDDDYPDAALTTLMDREAEIPFDLQRGPLFRGCLIALDAGHHVLLITVHHIIIDGWSVSVLLRELGSLYKAFAAGAPDPLPLPPVQYADYAVWQRKWKTKEFLGKHSEYWREALDAWPRVLTLATDRERPQERDFTGDVIPLEFAAELTTELRVLGRRYGMTLYMLVLAAWALVLSHLSGQDDIVIGTPTANRTERPIQEVVGFFVNLLAVRVRLSGNPTVEQLLLRTKAATRGGLGHPHLPFEQILEIVTQERNSPLPTVFQVMLAWQNLGIKPPDLGGVEMAEIPAARPAAKFDLMLEINDFGDRAQGGLIYARALFDAETARRHVEQLLLVLKQLSTCVALRVTEVDLTGEYSRLASSNASAPLARCSHGDDGLCN